MTEASVVDENEINTNDAKSLNHSRTIQRICSYLERYDDEYDILPELEIKLNGRIAKPDISVYPNLHEDWDTDVNFMSEPPVIAIEVLSPSQPMTDITDKINQLYFPGGVKSVWIVLPLLQSVTVIVPDKPKITFSDGLIKDPVTAIELPLHVIFRKSR